MKFLSQLLVVGIACMLNNFAFAGDEFYLTITNSSTHPVQIRVVDSGCWYNSDLVGDKALLALDKSTTLYTESKNAFFSKCFWGASKSTEFEIATKNDLGELSVHKYELSSSYSGQALLDFENESYIFACPAGGMANPTILSFDVYSDKILIENNSKCYIGYSTGIL